jgi:hypothetical protein
MPRGKTGTGRERSIAENPFCCRAAAFIIAVKLRNAQYGGSGARLRKNIAAEATTTAGLNDIRMLLALIASGQISVVTKVMTIRLQRHRIARRCASEDIASRSCVLTDKIARLIQRWR